MIHNHEQTASNQCGRAMRWHSPGYRYHQQMLIEFKQLVWKQINKNHLNIFRARNGVTVKKVGNHWSMVSILPIFRNWLWPDPFTFTLGLRWSLRPERYWGIKCETKNQGEQNSYLDHPLSEQTRGPHSAQWFKHTASFQPNQWTTLAGIWTKTLTLTHCNYPTGITSTAFEQWTITDPKPKIGYIWVNSHIT